MSIRPLTDQAIRKLRAGAKRRRIPDAGSRSLFLVIEPSGHKAFQMRFRSPGGRIGKVTLGPYAAGQEVDGAPVIGMPLTLAGARALAADVHRQRALGHDVIADRVAARQRQRIEIQQRDLNAYAGIVHSYIKEHASKRIRGWHWRARQLGLHYAEDGAGAEIIKGGLCDRWKDKPVTEIDQADIEALIIEARRLGIPGILVRNKGRSEARARGLFVALASFFKWLQQEHIVSKNPCRDMARPKKADDRERALSLDEVRWFWQAAGLVDAPRVLNAPRPFEPALKLLLLTGCRRDEVAGMRRSELSADGAVWNLPGNRTKNKKPHVVMLPPAARDLIREIAGAGDLIFTTTGRSPVSGWSRMKERLDKIMLEIARKEKPGVVIPAWRLHDLRRTFVTQANELGIAPHVIELCVNHVSGTRAGIAGIYNKSELLPERKAAMERWANFIAQLVAGETQADKVVPMRQRGML